MSHLSDISLRRAITLLIVVLAVLIGGTWLTVKLATDHLVDEYVKGTASDWAHFIADNITDLQQIAAGEQPSAASLAFFEGSRKSKQVLRYVIFNPQGYSQLVADRTRVALVNLVAYSAEAAQAAKQRSPVVDIKRDSESANLPSSFGEAYVPVILGNQPVAVVAAYVDEKEASNIIFSTFLVVVVALCVLIALSFGVPAIAWYLRTREKQQADRRIQFLAHHDPLTGLANRARLIERLEAALAVLPTSGGVIAVHFIDIDHFKQVNDTLGHDGGDCLLKTIGKRLNALTRIEDLVARLGGDEFIVVQTGVTDKAQADSFAQRIGTILSAPVRFKEQEICSSYTIGVALAPADGVTPERLLKSADLALYAGKAAGRNCIRFFSPEMDEAMRQRIMLEKTIRDAVLHHGFAVHYQPVFEIADKKLIGFEALLRLPASDGSLIPPATFIPVAEEMRLIDEIGAWVLHEACRTASTWPDSLTVAVNLSPAQFESGTIEMAVADALKTSGLAAQRLELEITETLLLGNNEATLATLRRLKDMGVSIVMDDFGTGYSSLSYLWKFPFDKIKIDRSFMESFEKSGRDVETVVRTIIALGREMHMRVTVEGVETSQQVDFLYDADADQVQGFYFGKPVPAAEVTADVLSTFLRTATGDPAEAKLRLVADGRE